MRVGKPSRFFDLLPSGGRIAILNILSDRGCKQSWLLPDITNATSKVLNVDFFEIDAIKTQGPTYRVVKALQ